MVVFACVYFMVINAGAVVYFTTVRWGFARVVSGLNLLASGGVLSFLSRLCPMRFGLWPCQSRYRKKKPRNDSKSSISFVLSLSSTYIFVMNDAYLFSTSERDSSSSVVLTFGSLSMKVRALIRLHHQA